ncbi:type III PLP-dependent enzyme domain-containing protein [Parasedimentitalea psychrophila]|uniref:D-serine dehydratase-like domain-containing protein n=1 Tax=Parasedimentitalea psychrophila TaxID=2997337 RepID=A0A9Y2P268_9RHOB|nr:hypothetical protein [Parasedimentitalea psychrophila]WIY24767.1 hypothetical protein QPJ95_19985 [Parasedimentitalea psychrophila]
MTKFLIERSNETRVDGKSRGIPADCDAFALKDAGRFGWSVPDEDLCLPVLTVCEPTLQKNLAVMDQYAREQDVWLCPHGKTMMSPQLLAHVLAGERTLGLSAATVAQARMMAECGAPVVLLANQLVGRSNIRSFAHLMAQFPATRFLMLVDSVAGLDQLVAHGASHIEKGQHFTILVEVGFQGARTGIQSMTGVDTVLQAVAAQQSAQAPVQLCGLQAYEGAIGGSHDERKARVADYLDFAVSAFNRICDSGLMPADQVPVFTAGGSSSFDFVVSACKATSFQRQPQIWLRGGVAATYDHLAYKERLAEMDARGGFVLNGKAVSAETRFQPAMAIWAAVQSLPEPGIAILAAGMRDFPYDAGLPVVLAQYRDGQQIADLSEQEDRLRLTRANDQHAFLKPAAGMDLRIGDVLKLGISHPCTAFDKWRFVFCVDAQDRVTNMAETFF